MGETPCCLTVQGVVLRVLATVIQTTSTSCVFITSTENLTSLYSRKHKYKPQLPHYRRPRNFETHPLVPADNCQYKLIHRYKPNHKKITYLYGRKVSFQHLTLAREVSTFVELLRLITDFTTAIHQTLF